METAQKLRNLLLAVFRRRIEKESVPRIKKCPALLSEKEVWLSPNENLNSVGSLILHICGHARQWIISGVEGLPDQRGTEFQHQVHKNKAGLSAMLDQLIEEVDAVLVDLPPDSLLEVSAYRPLMNRYSLCWFT